MTRPPATTTAEGVGVPGRDEEVVGAAATGGGTTAGIIVLATGATLAEIALLGSATRLPLGTLLAWHAVIVGLAAAWLSRAPYRMSRHGMLLLLSLAAFGALGGAGVLLAMALERAYARRATGVEDWHAMLFPPAGHDEHAALWRRIGQRSRDRSHEPDVTPFLDILTFGSVPQRQTAIAIIAQQFAPAFAPALRVALRDEHNVIRVQAATAIARLEQQFFERTVALEAAVSRSAEDPEAMLALASHFDQQAFAGLFDPVREERCRVGAAELFEAYLRLRPEDRAVEFRLARLLLRRGRVADAALRFRRLTEDGYPTARLWLMECLFAEGRYDALRQVAATEGAIDVDGSQMPPEVAQAVALWSGSEAAA